jgi:hypothetical protein
MKKADLPKDTMYDFRLGWVRSDTDLNGFNVYGADNAADGRVVTLGGIDGWAKHLYTQLGETTQIIDGSTDGYTSAQAMIMLIRDGLLLKPKFVICVSGYYNFAYQLGIDVSEKDAAILKRHPFATPNHIAYYTAISERLGLGRQGVYYGVETDKPAYETWIEHMKIMNELCVEFNIGFAAFLQPNKSADSRLIKCYDDVIKSANNINFIHTIDMANDPQEISKTIKETLWND